MNRVDNFLGKPARNPEQRGQDGEDEIPQNEAGKQALFAQSLAGAPVDNQLADETQQEHHSKG